MSLYKGDYSFNKIRQYSFIVEYVFIAFMCILIIRKYQPSGMDFGLYWPLMLNISMALIYSVVLYVYSGKTDKPPKIELVMRFLYLFIAGKLLIETNNPSVQIILVLPTVIMALRYPLKYTIITAGMTTGVVLVNAKIYNYYEFDYLFLFICFIWVIGFLVNASMEVERQVQEERRKLQEKENLAAIGQMAAGIAHEVRNPLTTIKGFVQLLDRYNGVKDPSILKDYLTMIDKEIDRVNSLLKDFLLYAKPSKPELCLSNINDTIEDIRVLMEAQCTSKGITMIKAFVEDLPDIYCDKNQIKQVIMNIALNAIDAMQDSEQKELKLETIRDYKYVYIKIKDSGSGISQDKLRKIFNPFFTTKESGTGLGLSVCYSIIDNHHGIIKVKSEEGKGTEFIICLPITIASLANSRKETRTVPFVEL